MRYSLRTLLASLALVVAVPAQATDWVEVKTQHFIIYGKQSGKALSQMATRLEKLNQLMVTVFQDDPDSALESGERPLIVYVIPENEVQTLSGRRTAAGYYDSDERNGYAMVSSGKTAYAFDLDQEVILFHEFAHHYMLARSNAAYPAWYIEGFAEFFSTLKFAEGDQISFGHIPMARVPQLVTTNLYPIGKLLRESAYKLGLSDGDRYYGAAWLLTHYCVFNKQRAKELDDYLTALSSPGGARDPADYFQGGDKALTKELQEYMQGRIKGFRLSLRPLEKQPVARILAPDEQAMMRFTLRLKAGQDEEALKKLVAEIRKAMAPFPDSALAQVTLGTALARQEDWGGALAAADAAIRIDPASSRAHTLRANILIGKGQDAKEELPARDIVTAILAANKADLDDPYPLFLFYRFKRSQGDKITDNVFSGLLKAFNQLPQNEFFRWTYADALAQRKDYVHAVEVITPLANDPHGGNGAAAAQKQRERYIALRDGKPEPVDVEETKSADPQTKL